MAAFENKTFVFTFKDKKKKGREKEHLIVTTSYLPDLNSDIEYFP